MLVRKASESAGVLVPRWALEDMTLGVAVNAGALLVMTLGASASAWAVLVISLGCLAAAAAVAGSVALASCLSLREPVTEFCCPAKWHGPCCVRGCVVRVRQWRSRIAVRVGDAAACGAVKAVGAFAVGARSASAGLVVDRDEWHVVLLQRWLLIVGAAASA